MRALGLAGAAMLLGACSGETFVVVTVNSEPAVHGAESLKVTLTNGSATLSNNFALGAHDFPVTFSVSSPTSSGSLTIDVQALDATSALVGEGTLTTDLDASNAAVTLSSADFVVNTEFPMDQYLSDDFEATGTQLGSTPDGLWTVGFRDDCNSPCNMYARRFDSTGTPVTTALGAGTNQFNVTTTLTDFFSTPTVAGAMTKTLELWDSHDDTTTPSTDGIACRPLDPEGNGGDEETAIATEPGTDVVSATGLANGNFAVTWSSTNGSASNLAERSMIVAGDCSVKSSPVTINPAGATDPRRSAVGSSGNTLLYGWIDSGNLHVRGATTGNVFTTNDITLLTKTSTLSVEHVRIAALGSAGYAVAVRWYSETDQTAPGKIELYLVSAAGAAMGPPTLVTNKSGSDFASTFSFGMAARTDGAILITWHACLDNGDGQGCGVFARLFRESGAPVGDAFGVPTTTIADQTNPSVAALSDSFVVAWNDLSALAPDVSGLAVRARIVYPPFDDATAISGATCGDGLPACNSPLVCAAGTDGSRCYAACSATMTCPAGGTCTAGACVF